MCRSVTTLTEPETLALETPGDWGCGMRLKHRLGHIFQLLEVASLFQVQISFYKDAEIADLRLAVRGEL